MLATAKVSGYLSGLSSPSVTERIDDLVRLAEIEACRTNEVADILDEQDRFRLSGKLVERVPDHMGVEVTAAPGVDLHCGHARGADALGVDGGLLIALDNGDRQPDFNSSMVLTSSVVLPEPGLETRLIAKTPASRQALAVLSRKGVVPGEDVLLDAHEVMRMACRLVVVTCARDCGDARGGDDGRHVMLALVTATAYAAHGSFSSGWTVQCVCSRLFESPRISSRMRCMILFSSS